MISRNSAQVYLDLCACVCASAFAADRCVNVCAERNYCARAKTAILVPLRPFMNRMGFFFIYLLLFDCWMASASVECGDERRVHYEYKHMHYAFWFDHKR